MTALPPIVAIYADESCLGNGRDGNNPGGAAGVIEYVNARTGQLTRWDYWVSEPATTNNRMALRSFIEAMHVISRKGRQFRVSFTSDSQYLVKGLREWLYTWMRHDWRRNAKAGSAPLENLELWKEVVAAVRAGGHQLAPRWVRGHHGHPQNEYANHLATRAAREQSHSEGAVESAFDEWLAAHRLKSKMTDEPDAFPANLQTIRPY